MRAGQSRPRRETIQRTTEQSSNAAGGENATIVAARSPSSVMLRMTPSPALREKGSARGLPLDKRYALLGVILIAPTVLILCAVIVYPLISAIYMSLFSIYTPTLKGSWV